MDALLNFFNRTCCTSSSKAQYYSCNQAKNALQKVGQTAMVEEWNCSELRGAPLEARFFQPGMYSQGDYSCVIYCPSENSGGASGPESLQIARQVLAIGAALLVIDVGMREIPAYDVKDIGTGVKILQKGFKGHPSFRRIALWGRSSAVAAVLEFVVQEKGAIEAVICDSVCSTDAKAPKLKLGVSTVPALAIHGSKDEIVPIARAQEVLKAYHGPLQVMAVPGCGRHGMRPLETIARAVFFLAGHLEIKGENVQKLEDYLQGLVAATDGKAAQMRRSALGLAKCEDTKIKGEGYLLTAVFTLRLFDSAKFQQALLQPRTKGKEIHHTALVELPSSESQVVIAWLVQAKKEIQGLKACVFFISIEPHCLSLHRVDIVPKTGEDPNGLEVVGHELGSQQACLRARPVPYTIDLIFEESGWINFKVKETNDFMGWIPESKQISSFKYDRFWKSVVPPASASVAFIPVPEEPKAQPQDFYIGTVSHPTTQNDDMMVSHLAYVDNSSRGNVFIDRSFQNSTLKGTLLSGGTFLSRPSDSLAFSNSTADTATYKFGAGFFDGYQSDNNVTLVITPSPEFEHQYKFGSLSDSAPPESTRSTSAPNSGYQSVSSSGNQDMSAFQKGKQIDTDIIASLPEFIPGGTWPDSKQSYLQASSGRHTFASPDDQIR